MNYNINEYLIIIIYYIFQSKIFILIVCVYNMTTISLKKKKIYFSEKTTVYYIPNREDEYKQDGPIFSETICMKSYKKPLYVESDIIDYLDDLKKQIDNFNFGLKFNIDKLYDS